MTSHVFSSVLSASAILAGFAIPLVAASASATLGVAGVGRGESSRRFATGLYWLILAGATLTVIVTILASSPWWVAPSAALVGGVIALGSARRVLLRAKKQQGPDGHPVGVQRIASSGPPARRALPTGRFLFAYVISLATILTGALVWESIPVTLPVHWNAAGNADSFAPKGWLTAFAGAWIGLFLTTVLLLVAKLSSRRAFRLGTESSEEIFREQEEVDQWATQGTCASVAVIFSIASALLSLLTWVDAAHGVVVVSVMVAMFAALLLTVFGYQLARRAYRAPATAWSEGAGGDDAFWIAGLVYVNRQDRAVIVPKRFGTGWTLNLGRPTAFLSVATGLVLMGIGVVIALMQSSPG